jgi:hypothetical protein
VVEALAELGNAILAMLLIPVAVMLGFAAITIYRVVKK